MTNMLVAHRYSARVKERGLTLVEVMISVLLLSILALGAFAAFSAQQTASSTQQRADSALDAARSLITQIGMQLRAAKGGAPVGNIKFNNVAALTANPDSPINGTTSSATGANCSTLTNQYQVPTIQVLDNVAPSGADRLRIIYPDGSAWGTTENVISNMSSPSPIVFRTYDNTTTTPVAPLLGNGDWVLVSNLAPLATNCTTATAASVCFTGFCNVSGTTSLCVNTQTVLYQVNSAISAGNAGTCGGVVTDFCFTTPASSTVAPYPFVTAANNISSGGGFLVRARWIEYAIDDSGTDNAGADGLRYLMMKDLLSATLSSVPVAEAIEDMQVALGYDLNNNGVIETTSGTTTNEWLNASDSRISGSNACSLGPLLAVRLSIVARATSQDERAVNIRPAVENHAAATAADGYYRVVLQSIIALR